MINKKLKIALIAIAVIFASPQLAFGLALPGVMSLTEQEKQNLDAKAYIVTDLKTGQVILQKDAQRLWPPASLTKLVTALVFLDNNVSLDRSIKMTKSDEVGGVRIATKAGVAYRVRDLLNASLIASANNATNALARSTNLTSQEFVKKMNEKVANLGAKNTNFIEPTGISENNYTTAEDFVKILNAAFSNSLLKSIAQKTSYKFTSTNNKKYTHNLKTTNKLLGEGAQTTSSGKTGFLYESLYNFATISQDPLGNEFAIVLLGAGSATRQFGEAKELLAQATMQKVFAGQTAVLGASIVNNLIYQ